MANHNIKIKYVSCNNIRKVDRIVSNAVNFLESTTNTNPAYFDFICIVSSDFCFDCKQLHGNAQVDDGVNGIFIPTAYQKQPDEKDIIIINWGELHKCEESFITSVFIHEFSHFLDYQLYPMLEKKYNIKLSLDINLDSMDDIIGDLFYARSEMRSAYFQEKYICSNIPSKKIIDQITNYAAQITSKNDTHNIAHLTGQFLCWKELIENGVDVLQPIKDQLAQIWKNNPDYKFDKLFMKDNFIEHCDKIYKN